MSLGNMEQSRQQKLMRSTQADEGKVAVIGFGRGTAVKVTVGSRSSSQAGAAGVAYHRPLSLQAGLPASRGVSCCRCRLSAVRVNRELTETIWRNLGKGGLARFMKQLR
jgi:hypothetical protein